MKLLSIGNGMAFFALSADDCALLSRALDAADLDDQKPGEFDMIMAMGAAFKASAIVGLAQWNMHVPELESLDKAMQAAGLAPS
jgi:hypothetical protein